MGCFKKKKSKHWKTMKVHQPGKVCQLFFDRRLILDSHDKKGKEILKTIHWKFLYQKGLPACWKKQILHESNPRNLKRMMKVVNFFQKARAFFSIQYLKTLKRNKSGKEYMSCAFFCWRVILWNNRVWKEKSSSPRSLEKKMKKRTES